MTQATTLRGRRRSARAHARGGVSLRVAVLSIAILSLATAFGLFLLTRSGASGAATGQEHTLGVAAAPAVVEEWSDFQ